jgi:7-cyano-7-deazaguanine synthase
MPRAVVLLSGGLDSCVAAAIAQHAGHELHALSVDYGQRHAREVEAAAEVARSLGVRAHKTVRVDLGSLGGSALTDPGMQVPQDRAESAMAYGIPSTYVPARNTVLLAVALGWAEVLDADAVYYGANALDYSGYPDCRPEFVRAFQALADVATKRGVEGKPIRIEAPLIALTKADIVRRGLDLKAPLALTWSCYLGGAQQCGRCDSCQLRRKGFREAGVQDPVPYADAPAGRHANP